MSGGGMSARYVRGGNVLQSLIIIIIITTTMFMVLSSWQSHCESSPGSFDELIQKTLDVLSLLRPIVHDTSKTAKITWIILVLHWGMDVI